jgi:hypothetical protein
MAGATPANQPKDELRGMRVLKSSGQSNFDQPLEELKIGCSTRSRCGLLKIALMLNPGAIRQKTQAIEFFTLGLQPRGGSIL